MIASKSVLFLTGLLLICCSTSENLPENDDDGDGFSEVLGDCDDTDPDRTFFCGIRVDPGSFEMGCSERQADCSPDEAPAHNVELTQPFEMAETEVTQALFINLMGFNPSYFSACGPTCPADYVSWNQAAEFMNRLSTVLGLEECYACADGACSPKMSPLDCEGFRMPTEAEWEFAARCGTNTVLAGSDSPDEVAWTVSNSEWRTHPVGLLSPNACGFYDLSGNVWEWVWDIYDPDYYQYSPSVDPTGPETGEFHVYRGGGYANVPEDARVSDRCADCHPFDTVNAVGLRVARTLP